MSRASARFLTSRGGRLVVSAGLIALVAIAAVAAVPPRGASADAAATAPRVDLERELHRTGEALVALLLPNTMARTRPRTDAEVGALVREVIGAADHIRADRERAIPFLRGVLAATTDEDEPALAALQLLAMLDDPWADAVIAEARQHRSETVARTATTMTVEGTDLLSGFAH